MQHATKMVLVPSETLSAVKDPRPVSTETFTRSKLDQELKEIINKTDLTPYDKIQRYNQILQRYMTFYNQTTKRPITVKVTQDDNVDPPVPREDDQAPTHQPQDGDEVPHPEGGLGTATPPDIHAAVDKHLANFPLAIKNKAKTLYDMIRDSNGILDFNDQGELLLDGHVIKGSHVSDLVYDVLFGKSGFEPRGVEQFLGGLARLNVPERLIGNKKRRTVIRQMKLQSFKSPPVRKRRGATPSIGKRTRTSTGTSKPGRRTSNKRGHLNWETYT